MGGKDLEGWGACEPSTAPDLVLKQARCVSTILFALNIISIRNSIQSPIQTEVICKPAARVQYSVPLRCSEMPAMLILVPHEASSSFADIQGKSAEQGCGHARAFGRTTPSSACSAHMHPVNAVWPWYLATGRRMLSIRIMLFKAKRSLGTNPCSCSRPVWHCSCCVPTKGKQWRRWRYIRPASGLWSSKLVCMHRSL